MASTTTTTTTVAQRFPKTTLFPVIEEETPILSSTTVDLSGMTNSQLVSYFSSGSIAPIPFGTPSPSLFWQPETSPEAGDIGLISPALATENGHCKAVTLQASTFPSSSTVRALENAPTYVVHGLGILGLPEKPTPVITMCPKLKEAMSIPKPKSDEEFSPSTSFVASFRGAIYDVGRYVLPISCFGGSEKTMLESVPMQRSEAHLGLPEINPIDRSTSASTDSSSRAFASETESHE
ncbi:hypothetical protein PIIN_09112 [Serendipita indica DSM 11827]|uniref:Uncharacterized protein n=1 Tax=Serendipita indica (strain DSM 11827) TaxID=1109443 RepID=G4TUY5_SERID|nr:hypothetical protein PIIN_09112 [Serendipita indica DSM 11827]